MKESVRVTFSRKDVEAALRLVHKIAILLQKRGKGALSTYLALKILIIDLEHDFGFHMTPEDDAELREFLRELDAAGGPGIQGEKHRE